MTAITIIDTDIRRAWPVDDMAIIVVPFYEKHRLQLKRK